MTRRLSRRSVIAGLAAAPLLAACGAPAGETAARAEARYPPIGQFVTVGGRRIHAVVRGRGPDLVLIHGASANVRDFTFGFVDRMARRYRVIAMDRPGHGYSDRARASLGPNNTDSESPAEQAVLLQAAAARLGARRPIVLGHSYGGAVGLAWALDRPNDIAALVTVSAVSHPWPGNLAEYYPFTASSLGSVIAPIVAANATDGRVQVVLRQIFAPQPVPAGYADRVGVDLALRRDTFLANARQVNSLRPHIVAMAARYPGLRLPVEVVHGTADRIVGFELHAPKLARDVPRANLVALNGVGHMPHHVAPGQVAAAVDRAARRAGLR